MTATTDGATVLRAQGLTAGYDAHDPIVQHVDLRVQAGRFVAVLGPNGAGKTTLLRTLTGVLEPLTGTVLATIDRRERPLGRFRPGDRARHVAVVLTDHPDVGLLRARDVVAIGRHPHTGWSGRLGPADHEAIDAALEAVGASHLAGRELAQLSDGQRQRIWIARALAQQPAALLLDEPTAFLDLPGRVETTTLLRDLARSRDLAVVASIHDLDLALRVADEVWLVHADGHVTTGIPEQLVLDGEIDRAFGREGIRFDAGTGSFATSGPTGARASVKVDDDVDRATALWTRRTLVRLGYRLDGVDETGLLVQVSRSGWQVHRADGITAVSTLSALDAAIGLAMADPEQPAGPGAAHTATSTAAPATTGATHR